MLANLSLLAFFLISTLASWLILKGWALALALVLISIIAVMAWSFADKAILYFLGAREVVSSDAPELYKEAIQQAYKLSVKAPSLYLYNGSFDRAFVLVNGDDISIVLSRNLIDVLKKDELAAICFSLLLQAKKGLAGPRTKGMFIICMSAWIAHALGSFLGKILPFDTFKEITNLMINYFLHPIMRVAFKVYIGDRYFRKLSNYLDEFSEENNLLKNVYLKIRHPDEIYSVVSRRLMEMTSSKKSLHYQNILTLELLPHEWDFYQKYQEGLSDKEASRA